MNKKRQIIIEEVAKAIFLNEKEIYIDITDLPFKELFPEEIIRMKAGFGKAGYLENGNYKFMDSESTLQNRKSK